MKPETVEKGYTIDTFKIIPRALILMWMYLTYTVIFVMSLDVPTIEQTALVSVVTAHAAFGLFLGHSKDTIFTTSFHVLVT